MTGDDNSPRPADPTVRASADEIAAALEQAQARQANPLPHRYEPGAGSLVGVKLNDMFEVVRYIDRGGMGEVYEGHNIISGERVAIKVILPQFAADQQFFALFRREAAALERLAHDALVKYRALALDRTVSVHYLATEFVDGPTLSSILSGSPADPAVVKTLLRRLASGLAAAHDVGVIHRDLSPDNVLLPAGQLERAKIIDFGIAKDTNLPQGTVVGESFAGRLGYAAPEMFGMFGRAVGPWTDVYSLGLVVLALALGRPLEMGVTVVDAITARAAVPDLAFLRDDLRPLFTRMLEPDPALRFRRMDDVLEALSAAAGSIRAPGVAAADPPQAPMAGQVAAVPPSATALPSAASPAAIPPPAAPAATMPPGDGGDERQQPAFVRADDPTTGPVVAPLRRGRTVLAAVAGSVTLLVAGLVFMFTRGDGEQALPPASAPPRVAERPPATPRASAPLDWETVRPTLVAALADVPCSDVRPVQPAPGEATVQLIGWRSSRAPLPDTLGDFRLDTSQVALVDAPSRATCQLIDDLRRVAPGAPPAGMALRLPQTIDPSTAPRDASGNVLVDLGASLPAVPTRFVSIDDNPAPGFSKVYAIGARDINLDAVAFAPSDSHILIALVSGPTVPVHERLSSDLADIAAACASASCAFTSGWLRVGAAS